MRDSLHNRVLGGAVAHVEVEAGFYFDTKNSSITDNEREIIQWLLSETYEQAYFRFDEPFLVPSADSDGASSILLEFGPRMTFTSAYSTNAVSICASVGIPHITRMERTRRILVHLDPEAPRPSAQDLAELADHLHGAPCHSHLLSLIHTN